jgi:CTP:molybdopterin cytidylyltransferase MocA
LGHRAEEIRVFTKNVTIAINPDENSEMGASIAAGIRATSDNAKCVLIALVDHPAIPATVVSQLIAEWQNGARIVIPSWQNRGGHPVLVDLGFRTELLNLDQAGGLRGLLKTHESEVKRVPVDSPFVARDMDTWDDYVALYEEAFGHPPPQRLDRTT